MQLKKKALISGLLLAAFTLIPIGTSSIEAREPAAKVEKARAQFHFGVYAGRPYYRPYYYYHRPYYRPYYYHGYPYRPYYRYHHQRHGRYWRRW